MGATLAKLHPSWPGKLNMDNMKRFKEAQEEATSCDPSRRHVLFYYKHNGRTRLLHMRVQCLWRTEQVAKEFAKQALLPPCETILLFKERPYRDCCGYRHQYIHPKQLIGLVFPFNRGICLLRVVYETKKGVHPVSACAHDEI